MTVYIQRILGLSSSDPDDPAARPPINPSLILESARPDGNATDEPGPVALSCRNSVQGIELIADDRGARRAGRGGGAGGRAVGCAQRVGTAAAVVGDCGAVSAVCV